MTYEEYTKGIDSTFRGDLAATIPSATAGQSLQRVYGGVALTIPADQVGTLLALPGVAAVQLDTLSQPQTDSSFAEHSRSAADPMHRDGAEHVVRRHDGVGAFGGLTAVEDHRRNQRNARLLRLRRNSAADTSGRTEGRDPVDRRR